MKKIFTSILTVGLVATVAVVASQAFFSDTETSTGNTFTAGAIDLLVDYSSSYNGDQLDGWTLKDLTESDTFFDFADLKPGDYGEGTISLHVYDNNAYACATINPTLNDDMSSTEPELEADDTKNTDSIFDGELAQNMKFKVWADICNNDGATPGDNTYQPECDRLLTKGDGPITPITWPLASPDTLNVFTNEPGGALVGSEDYFLGVEWSIADSVGNIIQTDKYMADISFYAEQSRNNEGFVCPTIEPQANTLRLENEEEVDGGPWKVLDDDEIYADLTWTDGPKFAYTLNAKGLSADTKYSLIYYADGWPGNNPGALIGTHKTDGSGELTGITGSKELNMDLPHPDDGNYAVGAKIWLVLASDHDGTGMTAWNPDSYLFEGNVYIHYNDTGI